MRQLRLRTIIAIALACAFATAASAQTASKKSTPAPKSSTSCPANQEIPASLRAQRDHYWNEATAWLMGPYGEIEEPSGGSIDLTVDPFDVPGKVILTATYMNYRRVLSANAPYLELTLCVDHVFGSWSDVARPSPHYNVTLLQRGGSLRQYDMAVADLDLAQIDLLPGHKYLLILSYQSVGDFYEERDTWDITDGTVRANSPVTKYQATQGRSRVEGLTVQELGPALPRPSSAHR